MQGESPETRDNPHLRQPQSEFADLPKRPQFDEPEERHCLTPRELQLAARIHQSLLPQPVRHARIDIDIRYVPVHGIGGDYCQVLFPDDSSCCISICDVTGHGVGPGLLATRVSSEVRKLTHEGRGPSDILDQLNAFLLEHFQDSELLVSFFAARIDLSQGTITYAGGGHPSPLLLRCDGQHVEPLASQNMLLGVREDCLGEEPEQSVEVAKGDRLLLFTDGLPETYTREGRLLGEAGLVEIAKNVCVTSALDVADCILDCVAERRSGPPTDDLTLIVAEMK